MNDLLATMSSDMGIRRYYDESEKSFIYRLCYSALGQWCLRTAQSESDGVVGATKHNQTIVLNELMVRFAELFPSITERLLDIENRLVNFPVHIRRVYEETGYFLTDGNNRNRIANYGRSLPMGNTALFFGVPNTTYVVNGLGVFSCPTQYRVSVKEFMIRDNLTCEEYLRSKFDPIDFYDRDVTLSELEFFNPKSNNVPSQSWGKKMETDCTIARKSEAGPFYRVMLTDDAVQFADEPVEPQNYSFTSYEYRRLYFALKAHYGKPIQAVITKKDGEYSRIRIGGYLPNREYYLLLLLSWPEKNAFDKANFLIRNALLSEVISALTNIGIEIIGGCANA